MSEQKPGTLCRRCLLIDTLTGEEYDRIVTRAKDAINARLRTGEDEYQQRLSACRQCAHLDGATCMQCGCLVEVRALRRDSHCPLRTRAW